jgi:hypothetical protein
VPPSPPSTPFPAKIDEACFLLYKPPVSLRERRSVEDETEFFRKALRKLDLTFGLK